ncbi:unnamed protein product [Caenorhabditis auriculariae]|uniref:Uncharacterized protein n=1 Tax=Caenorhabditis auriculariae TaxID=2777116 RepID=A0A8S1HJK0_9PELO|nr:unnamed protein product [Caenorhabditis auriculariae]
MSERVRRRREVGGSATTSRLRTSAQRECGGLSPASRLRIAADVHRHSTSDDDSGCVLEEYAWVPSGLKPDMVHAYFSCLPEDKVPYVNSAGEKWRQRQLRFQLPPQDSDVRYCEKLTSDEQDELRMFERGRKTECLGRGVVQHVPFDGKPSKCKKCSQSLEEGEMCVMASRTKRAYHPGCFRCHECDALLVDLIYFANDDKAYCGRHHAEQLKPRCAKCDELIFGEECTEAEGRTWHLHHFQCSDCGDVLGGKKYMQRANKPVCLNCFHSSTATLMCTTCKTNFPVETPHMSQGDLHWHASGQCFSCCVCSKNLLGIKYSLVGENLYCGYKTCGGEDELLDEDRLGSPNRRRLMEKTTKVVRIPASPRAPQRTMSAPKPRPPQRAPPPPPSENIYETVLPCSSSSSPEFEKKYGGSGRVMSSDAIGKASPSNYYSKTPNKLVNGDFPQEYSTSSSDSEDEEFYISHMMAAASLSRQQQPVRKVQTMTSSGGGVRVAKKKKSTRCIVS